MVTWPGAVSVTRTTFEIKKLFTRSKSSPVQFSMARKTCRRWRAHSVWIELGEPSSTTCPKRSWWKIHTQSPCVPFSNTKSTHGLGVRTWASCLQRSFCGSSPKFGEQHSSLLTLCRREKTEFLPRVTASETKITMEFQWFQHRMELIKWPLSLTAKYEPWT